MAAIARCARRPTERTDRHSKEQITLGMVATVALARLHAADS
jgi:hypothetical protein